MSRVAELLCSRRVPHLAALALISFGLAGCSADMSSRVSQNPFSNPFGYQPEATGTVPAPQIERRELPQNSRPQPPYPVTSAAPPAVAAPQSYPAASTGVSGRRAWARVLRAAGPAQARNHRERCAAFGGCGPSCRADPPAPRSLSAPATRSTFWRAATMFPRPRSWLPTVIKVRVRCRPASNSSFHRAKT